MHTVKDIGEYKRKVSAPLEIGGRNVYELSQQDPEAAYRLVYESIDKRGGFKPFFEHRARQSCISKAMAKPLPGAAEDAFLKGAVAVGGYTIYEVMPIHLKCLQVVDSPILKGEPVQSEDGQSVTVKMPEFEFQDEWNLCFIFTHDPEVLYDTPKSKLKELIESEGKRLFKPSKTGVVNSATVNGICSAIMRQLARHHSTVLRNEQEIDGNIPEKKKLGAAKISDMEAEGGGKILEYIANFREYAAMPGDTRRDVWCKIPMSEGYAAIAIGIHCHPVLNLFGQLKLSGGGYVGQQVERLMKEVK